MSETLIGLVDGWVSTRLLTKTEGYWKMSTVIFLPPSKQTWTGSCFYISLRSICAFFGGLCFYCHISESLLCQYGIVQLPVFLSGHALNLHLLCTFLWKTSTTFSGFKYDFECYFFFGKYRPTFHMRKMVWLTQLTGAKWFIANPHTCMPSLSKGKKWFSAILSEEG